MPSDPSPSTEPNDSNPSTTQGRSLTPLPEARDCAPQSDRKKLALDYRISEAQRACRRDLEPLKNRNNGEEQDLRNPTTGQPSYAASHTKGMPLHPTDDEAAKLGEVDPDAYERLLRAVDSEAEAAFEDVPTAFPTDPESDPRGRRYVDPQAGIALDPEGPDAASVAKFDEDVRPVRPALAPRLSEAELAGEMGEVYLQALVRDLPITQFDGGRTPEGRVAQILELINQFSDFRGPRIGGAVTLQTLFRGGNYYNTTPSLDLGDLTGPYISQLLLIGSRIDDPGRLPDQFSASRLIPPNAATGITLRREDGQIQFGTVTLDQRVWEVEPERDFATDYDAWLAVQQGAMPEEPNRFTGRRRFVYSGRQLANWVHFDQSAQAGLHAAFLLLSMQERADRTRQDLFGEGNPYGDSANQEGFVTFGNAHVQNLLWEVTTRALKATWYEKWFNQRRLRPEALAGRIHNVITGRAKPSRYKISDEIGSLLRQPGADILRLTLEYNADQNHRHGRPNGESYLLSQPYPEGSPMHTSMPAGHSAIAGAWATVLKALFNEFFTLTDADDPVLEPEASGATLIPYAGPGGPTLSLTLRDEVNKLASNVAFGRNWAGVHYRSDNIEGLLIGEYVAVGILQEQARSFNPDHFFELTLFSGTRIRIRRNGAIEIVGGPS